MSDLIPSGSHPAPPHGVAARDRAPPWFTLKHLELLLVASTLLATVIISSLTLRQTTNHFRLLRTAEFVARFNSTEMVALRERVDRWVESGESPRALYERSVAADLGRSGVAADQDASRETVAQLRTMANFFQEFGTALKVGALDEGYAHDLLGALCIRYGHSLEPFIMETRARRGRPQAYEEVLLLRDRMAALDPQTPAPAGGK